MEDISSEEYWFQLAVGLQELTKKRRKMIMEIHGEGSEESYRVKEKGAKEIWKRQMSQEELDKETVELKELLAPQNFPSILGGAS